MSLYSFVEFAVSTALPTAGVAAVTGSQMSVRVEEEEMLLLLRFDGRITGTNAEEVVLNFEVNGSAASAKPLAAHTFLTGRLDENFHIELPVALTKGEHKVALLADAGAGGATIDGGAVLCRFSATRVSSDATLAHGVGSKVQNIL